MTNERPKGNLRLLICLVAVGETEILKYFLAGANNVLEMRAMATLVPSSGIIGEDPGLLFLGGSRDGDKDEIFHFECDKEATTPFECKWKKLERKLKIPRQSGIPIIFT